MKIHSLGWPHVICTAVLILLGFPRPGAATGYLPPLTASSPVPGLRQQVCLSPTGPVRAGQGVPDLLQPSEAALGRHCRLQTTCVSALGSHFGPRGGAVLEGTEGLRLPGIQGRIPLGLSSQPGFTARGQGLRVFGDLLRLHGNLLKWC